MMKKIIKIFTALICFIGVFAGCEVKIVSTSEQYGVNIEEPERPEKSYNMKLIEGRLADYTQKARISFINAGIKCYDSDGNLVPQTSEIYKKLPNLSEDMLIGYYRYLRENKEETEKIVIALGYESWTDFLTVKGHLNNKGEPDINVWKDSVYISIQQKYD